MIKYDIIHNSDNNTIILAIEIPKDNHHVDIHNLIMHVLDFVGAQINTISVKDLSLEMEKE